MTSCNEGPVLDSSTLCCLSVPTEFIVSSCELYCDTHCFYIPVCQQTSSCYSSDVFLFCVFEYLHFVS